MEGTFIKLMEFVHMSDPTIPFHHLPPPHTVRLTIILFNEETNCKQNVQYSQSLPQKSNTLKQVFTLCTCVHYVCLYNI